MARPVSIQTNTILDAARKVFMRDGFKAGTAVIAREAGISEGSLFKHFKNKCNLFLMAMNTNAGEPSWEDNLMAAAGRADLRATLESTGLHLLQHLRLVLPRLMMVSSSGVTIPKHDHPGQRPPPLRKMDLLCRYFTAEVKAGRLVMDSPRIQAHAFLGALSHYAWCETLFNHRPASPEAYVKALVDALLKATASDHRQTRRTQRNQG